MNGVYHTISEIKTVELKVKGSKFIGFVFPLYDQTTPLSYLNDLKLTHAKASHHCYAYRFGADYRANDDGEPSGTAGRPILNQIDSFKLNYVLVVVVRYFGGTKLGVPGLISAYKQTAKSVLDEAVVIEKKYEVNVEISCDYKVLQNVMGIGKNFDWKIIKQQSNTESQTIQAIIFLDDLKEFEFQIMTQAGGLYPDEFNKDIVSKLLKFQILDQNA
jgi:uncharacterized YigZ family protein